MPTRVMPSTTTLINHIYSNGIANTNMITSGIILFRSILPGKGLKLFSITKFEKTNFRNKGKTLIQLIHELNCNNIMEIENPSNAFNVFIVYEHCNSPK